LEQREIPDEGITPLAVPLRQLAYRRFSELRVACRIAYPFSLLLKIENQIRERGEPGLEERLPIRGVRRALQFILADARVTGLRIRHGVPSSKRLLCGRPYGVIRR
jgi:hypothetical protein